MRIVGRLAAAALSIMLMSLSQTAAAQAYASKPMRIIVNFPAGGAGGNIGADAVAKSAPDGYSLVMSALGPHAVNVSLFSKMPYDPVRDFAPIALVLEAEGLVVLHPSVPATSVPELIAYARANPNKLTFASAGMGTASHLAGVLFTSMARVEMTHIPYKGNVPAITDLLAGQTSLLFATMPTVLPHARAGKLRALATIGARRSAAVPDLPTVGESLPGFEVNNWIGLFAPAGTPPDIVRRWNGEVLRVMQSPEIQSRLPTEGARFYPKTPRSSPPS